MLPALRRVGPTHDGRHRPSGQSGRSGRRRRQHRRRAGSRRGRRGPGRGGRPHGRTAARRGSRGAGWGHPRRRRRGRDGEPMSIEDQPTQRLRRPAEPPMPAPLNPTRPQNAAAASTPDDGTDVLSLDNLFERQNVATAPQATTPAASTTPAPTTPVASTPPAGPAEPPGAPPERRLAERRVTDRRVGDRRVGVVPVAAGRGTAHREPGLGQRLRHDSGTAVRGSATRTRDWFTAGDNALIVVTALVALALILVIGLV